MNTPDTDDAGGIDLIARAWAWRIRTAETVEVVSYDRAEQTVSIKRLTQAPRIGDDLLPGTREAPPIDGVPVAWLRAGSVTLTVEIEQGDRGLLIYRDSSHDEIDSGQGAGEQVTPQSSRRWKAADGIFLPASIVPADPIGPEGYKDNGDPVLGMGSGLALRVGASTATKALAVAESSASRIERIEAYLNTATFAVSGAVTTAPSPAPFSGATSLLPRSIASIVAAPVAATVTSDVASSRIFTDDP